MKSTLRLRGFAPLRYVFPFLLILLLTLLFFYPLAFTDHILARGDTYAYHYPYWAARNAALMAGHLPLWSPDLFMGVPLLANPQIGTFYPPNWIVAPLSPPEGIRVSILFHVAWAGIGTYLLARRTLEVSREAALAGAAIFAFGGYFGAHIEQINQLQGLSWIPWLLLIFDWALEKPFPRTIVLSIAIALQFFTGHTQTVFMSLIALGVYALLTRPVRGLIVLAVGGLIALVLTAPQLIPTLQLMAVSNWRGGFNLNQATAFSFSPFIAGRGLLPSYDGAIFSEYIAYVGVIGLGLALFGIKRKKSLNAKTQRRKDAKDKGKENEKLANSPLAIQSQNSFINSLSAFAPLRLCVKFLAFLSRLDPYVVLSVIGLVLAFGAFNPLYWLLAGLPGFNLFRVPARWLALFALGAAMLASRGLQRLLDGERPSRRAWIGMGIVIGGLAISTALTGRMDDGTSAPPTTIISVIGWVVAGIALVILASPLTSLVKPHPPTPSPKRGEGDNVGTTNGASAVIREANGRAVARPYNLLLIGLMIELFVAGRILPAQNLVPPEAYDSQRFTISQLLALNEGQNPPGRVLSISDGLFDPGDRAALESRWFDLSPESLHNAFVTVKQRELLAPNLPLIYGIPSVDGFDGGLLPTSYYTAFTSLMLPEGELRTIDGRLRESMASEACRGACIPEQWWLNLTNTRWIILDKVYDIVHDGIFYDMSFPIQLGMNYSASYHLDVQDYEDFEATEIRIVYHCGYESCDPPTLAPIYEFVPLADLGDGFHIASFASNEPRTWDYFRISDAMGDILYAVTLVDTRTGDFQQLAAPGWRRVLSSDVKVYENLGVLPRAFMIYNATWTPDTDLGTEQAHLRLREMIYDPYYLVPSRSLVLAGNGTDLDNNPYSTENTVTFREYTPERVVIDVETAADGYLLLTDAYYPGWQATIDGEPTTIYRADIMFRAVFVPEGRHVVIFTYNAFFLP